VREPPEEKKAGAEVRCNIVAYAYAYASGNAVVAAVASGRRRRPGEVCRLFCP